MTKRFTAVVACAGLLLVSLLLALPASAATCLVAEYRSLARDTTGMVIQGGLEPSVAQQSVTYTTASASAAFNSITRFIRVVCTAKAHFRVTTAGTAATAAFPYVPADRPEIFGVQPGDKISFYDGTS